MAPIDASPFTAAIIVLSTLLTGCYLIYELYRMYFARGKRLPPGPLFHPPILGDSIFLGTGNPLRFFFSRLKRYGPVFRLELLGTRAWLVNDVAALRPILKDENAEPEIPFPTFKALMGGETLLRAHAGGAHASFRKIFTTAVGPAGLAAMAPRVLEVMHSRLRGWEEDGKVPLYNGARMLGIDMAVDVILQNKIPEGVDREYFKEQVQTFFDGLYGLPVSLPGSALSRAKAAKAWLLKVLEPGVRELHAEFRRQLDAVGGSLQEYAAMVMDKATEQQQQQQQAPAEDDNPRAYSPALATTPSVPLAQLISRAAFGHLELSDAAFGILHILVGAGDTTRFGVFNSWVLIAMSPRVQDRIFEEQQQVIAQHGPELTYEATLAMPYLEATIKEAWRVLPASAGSFRRLTEDAAVGDYVIPKGELIWYHSGLLHCTDPALWDGDTSGEIPTHMDWRTNFEGAFRPERWLAGGEERPRSYFTFGSGAHLCAGMNVVYMEVKLMLALVLRKYRIRLEHPDMMSRLDSLFPYLVPAKGTDNVLLEPREQPAA